MEKMCLFPFFPMKKMGKKYMEREGNEYFSLFFYILFFPFFPMGKNGKKHIFPMGKNGVGPPPNNLIENGNIRYRLIDAKKQKNLMIGDGIGTLLTTAFNMIKPALPKIASTIGLAGLSTGISHGINKALKKDHIIKISNKQLNDINKNLEKINKINVFDKKITLNQKGSGIFSFLLSMLTSTIIPALIPKKGSSISNKNNFF